jgi:hypothetical protein
MLAICRKGNRGKRGMRGMRGIRGMKGIRKEGGSRQAMNSLYYPWNTKSINQLLQRT